MPLFTKKLELRTGLYKCLTLVVGRELREVLDETACEVGSLGIPLGRIGVGVAGIEDGGIYAGSSVGTLKSNTGICLVGALSIEPSRMASMMPRVSLIEIRLPVPFQPVFTR